MAPPGIPPPAGAAMAPPGMPPPTGAAMDWSSGPTGVDARLDRVETDVRGIKTNITRLETTMQISIRSWNSWPQCAMTIKALRGRKLPRNRHPYPRPRLIDNGSRGQRTAQHRIPSPPSPLTPSLYARIAKWRTSYTGSWSYPLLTARRTDTSACCTSPTASPPPISRSTRTTSCPGRTLRTWSACDAVSAWRTTAFGSSVCSGMFVFVRPVPHPPYLPHVGSSAVSLCVWC